MDNGKIPYICLLSAALLYIFEITINRFFQGNRNKFYVQQKI